MSTPPDISVILCAYSEARWDTLVAAVESVRGQTIPPREIVVAVDHNPALTRRVRERLPGVMAIENTGAQGLSDARNSGVAAATGAIVAFLDDDAVAAQDWLTRLVAAYQRPDVIGVGGAIEPCWPGARPAWFPGEFDWVVGCTYHGLPTTSAPVRNLIGCNMSFRREALTAVGGFRDGIGRRGARPTGCEETELCIRLSRYRPEAILLYEPRAAVRHAVSAQRACWSYFSSRCYHEGLSKAQVAREVGSSDALRSERAYVTRVLPRAILRGVLETLAPRRPAGGLRRAGAIVAGLGITTLGYFVGKVQIRVAVTGAGHTRRSDEQLWLAPLSLYVPSIGGGSDGTRVKS